MEQRPRAPAHPVAGTVDGVPLLPPGAVGPRVGGRLRRERADRQGPPDRLLPQHPPALRDRGEHPHLGAGDPHRAPREGVPGDRGRRLRLGRQGPRAAAPAGLPAAGGRGRGRPGRAPLHLPLPGLRRGPAGRAALPRGAGGGAALRHPVLRPARGLPRRARPRRRRRAVGGLGGHRAARRRPRGDLRHAPVTRPPLGPDQPEPRRPALLRPHRRDPGGAVAAAAGPLRHAGGAHRRGFRRRPVS